ncbi:MerR family transcriptional regulator [Kribbella ginsengisoli]|uniref:Helix-turn-helix domain-containing protein n=1 Tax=Kribbella ginsengisoli TaxID=363865 RepID=A0ABP6XAS0_9ACTN
MAEAREIEGELTIGEFGRRSGLSHKALRLYDVSGLLAPSRIAPGTGARLYSTSQLERARRISVMRQLDMPLATITEVLSGSDEDGLIRLDRWWAAEQATNQARHATLEYLRDRMLRSSDAGSSTGPGWPARDVLTRSVPAAKVAAIRADTDQQSLIGVIVSSTLEIRAHLAQAGAELTGGSWVIYHGPVTPESEATVEVCVPFTGAVEPGGPIAIRVEPARTEAYCTISKDECAYPRIMLAYDLLDNWIRRSGRPTTGAVREIYHHDFQYVDGPALVVDIAQPIEGTAR